MKKITRIWHGRVKTFHADEYVRYVEETGMKEYSSIKGNLSSKLLKRIDNDVCHILTITEWDSYESIKQFAGEDFELAKYYPKDDQYLLEKEEYVLHYETFEY